MKDLVLFELMHLSSFTKDDFVSIYRKHHPLNMMDPIWQFIVDEQIARYLGSGAVKSLNVNSSDSSESNPVYSVTAVVRNKYQAGYSNDEAIAI